MQECIYLAAYIPLLPDPNKLQLVLGQTNAGYRAYGTGSILCISQADPAIICSARQRLQPS